jgi:hypothetical protein
LLEKRWEKSDLKCVLDFARIEVGFAPLKPAEFVVIKFQQMTGKIDTQGSCMP